MYYRTCYDLLGLVFWLNKDVPLSVLTTMANKEALNEVCDMLDTYGGRDKVGTASLIYFPILSWMTMIF